jgi:hypothetical protein
MVTGFVKTRMPMRTVSVEDDKPAKEQGTYLHPEAHGQPKSKGVNQPRLIREAADPVGRRDAADERHCDLT